jgi:hypothetical protein
LGPLEVESHYHALFVCSSCLLEDLGTDSSVAINMYFYEGGFLCL